MMGSSQHGHMASIGYDLYCKMLEDTIKEKKGRNQYRTYRNYCRN